jgi:hypothetical protein
MEPEAIFEKAIESELAGKRDKQISILRHVAKGLYAQQLQNYFAVFQREQIRIFLYEDFSSQPQVVLKDIWRFLQIDDTYIADTSNRFNVTSVRPSLLTRANHRLKINFSAFSGQSRLGAKPAAEEQQINRPPVLSRETRRHLIQVCSNDILELQNLLGRDLSGWLDVVSNEN